MLVSNKFESKYQMNDILKDAVSGFSGQVVVVAFYATGCTHYGLAPQKLKDDGTRHQCDWIDETRLVLVKAAKKPDAKKPNGGPGPHPKCY